ncbi:MAG: hypothetical protein ACOH5I_16825 [Oligoflexus sp.]
MAGTEWDDHLRLDLMRLKSELSVHSLKIAGPGLGFGHYYPKDKTEKQERQSFQTVHSSQIPLADEIATNHAQIKKNMPPKNRLATAANDSGHPMSQEFAATSVIRPLDGNAKIQKNDVFYKLLKSYFIDIVFVIGTLLVVLCGIGLAFDGHQFVWNWQDLQRWLPIRFLLDSSWLAVVAGFLGVFLVYWLFFKFVAGHTLGESLMRQEPKQGMENSGL